jgi:hypothetical protein
MQVGARSGRQKKSREEVSPVDTLKRLFGVPAHAQFLGFGVQCAGHGQFLSRFDRGNPGVECAWADSPESALLMRGWREVLAVSQSCPGTIEILLFDVGAEILVFPAR